MSFKRGRGDSFIERPSSYHESIASTGVTGATGPRAAGTYPGSGWVVEVGLFGHFTVPARARTTPGNDIWPKGRA